MNTFTLLVIAFAILAVAVAPDATNPAEKDAVPAKSPSRIKSKKAPQAKDTTKKPLAKKSVRAFEEEETNENDTEKGTSQPVKGKGQTKAQPAKKSPAKQIEEKRVDDDLDDVDNLLGEDEEEETKITVTIPSPKSINLKMNPIELGQQIAGLAEEDEEALNDHIEELKDLIRTNPANTTAGKFYRAALAAVSDPKRAMGFWVKQIKRQTSRSKNFIGGIGNGIRRVAEVDAPGTFLEGANALAYANLADGAKNFARGSDLVHDGLENGHAVVEMAGNLLNAVPIVGPIVAPIKSNIDQAIKTGLARNRYFWGRNAEELSRTYSNLQQDASENYEAKTRKLKSALSRRHDSDDDE